MRGPFTMGMFPGNSKIMVTLAILLVALFVSGIDPASNSNPANAYHDATANAFTEMLTKIVDMNEKRLNALMELTKLDSYNAGNGILREFKKETEGKLSLQIEEITKAIIYDMFYEVVCKDGVSHEMTNYKDIMSRDNKINWSFNRKSILNENDVKVIVNEILREMICKGNRLRKSVESPFKDSNHQHYEHKEEPRHHITSKANIDVIKKYGYIKVLIAEVLNDVICKENVPLELRNHHRNKIHGAGRTQNDEMLTASNVNEDFNTIVMISKRIREMICDSSNKRKIHNDITTWVAHTGYLMADYRDNYFGKNTKMTMNQDRNKYRSEKTRQWNPEDYADLIVKKYRHRMESKGDGNDKEGSDENVILLNDNYKNNGHTSHDSKNKKYLLFNESNSNNNIHKFSENLRSSCWKTSLKNCKKACKKTVRDVCDDYQCSGSMKRVFKKKCKRYCKEEY